MSNNTTTAKSTGGVGFFGLLAIVFITLKLLNVITWSWWLVTAPLWGPFALVLLTFILLLIFEVVKTTKN